LFAGLAGTTGLSDCPPSFISGLRPQPSPSGPPLIGERAAMGSPGSRTWCLHAMVLRPREVLGRLGMDAARGVAFRWIDGVGTPD